MKNFWKNIPWKWIGFGLGVIALIVAVKFLPVADWLKGFSEWVKQFGAWGIVLYAGVYALATVLFLPGWIFTVGAGVAFGLVWGTVAAITGATLGATLSFLIARYLARGAVSKRLEKNKNFKQIDSAIGKQGWKMIGLLRLSPLIPFNLSNYLYGLTSIAFMPYVIASFVGMLPGTVLYVYLGAVGKIGLEAGKGGGGRSTLEYVFLGVGLVATIVVTVIVSRVAKTALRQKSRH
jgi:uncharacterized membrane protein YdjX (TVP38/TMEM64 family)